MNQGIFGQIPQSAELTKTKASLIESKIQKEDHQISIRKSNIESELSVTNNLEGNTSLMELCPSPLKITAQKDRNKESQEQIIEEKSLSLSQNKIEDCYEDEITEIEVKE